MEGTGLDPTVVVPASPSAASPGEAAPSAASPGEAAPAVRRKRRRRRVEVAFVSGTSSEFLGRRPLPRAAQERPVVFVLGPAGVGKSAVARRLLDHPTPLHLTGEVLHDALTTQARRRGWREDIRQHPALVLDGPCFLHRRPAVLRMLKELLRLRAADGLRTMVCEGADRSPLGVLMEGVDAEQRATVALRFPVGRGRRRYALRLCVELGLDPRHALRADAIEPWTYDAALCCLKAIRDEERKERRRRRRHAVRVCDHLRLPRPYADRVMDLDPWTPQAAEALLAGLRDELSRKRRRRRRRRALSRGPAGG